MIRYEVIWIVGPQEQVAGLYVVYVFFFLFLRSEFLKRCQVRYFAKGTFFAWRMEERR
jgi:hypothetical protein